MDVVNLLQSRNRCLRRLLESAGDFVAKAEKGDFTGLSAFLERRDSTVRAFELYDRRITALLGALTDEAARQRLIERLRPVLAEREELVHSLLRSDERSFRLIENE
ncbi:MAG: hypothetical protein NDJ90_12555, partial [Oligoflexia bacterium]|nr:hypothetical protein [Oligoflexia bacterium]